MIPFSLSKVRVGAFRRLPNGRFGLMFLSAVRIHASHMKSCTPSNVLLLVRQRSGTAFFFFAVKAANRAATPFPGNVERSPEVCRLRPELPQSRGYLRTNIRKE